MDTALVIMLYCDADNHEFRQQALNVFLKHGIESVHWTVEDMINVYCGNE